MSGQIFARGFRAAFDSECEYGDQISEGEWIESDGYGGWQHVACADRDNEPMPSLACSRCFCVHNGEC